MKTRSMKKIENTEYRDPAYYDRFIDKMRTSKGINVPESSKTLKCPKCGFVFNIIYGRAIACSGCARSASGCKLARCPKCDQEFPLAGTMSGRGIERMSNTFSKYYDTI
ncbi:MAG TPA: hypothetical protein PK718_02165 [Candidatus Methanofastidiosa archaeon]|nr:hypothetical protein [Candidatus Methanofastidiosa archaeon]